MKIEGFIIHLERAEARRSQVDELMGHLPVPGQILAAVDGQSLSPAEMSVVYRQNLYDPHYPFKLRASEIACFLSHRKAWRTIVERNLDAALVLEDDVDLVPAMFERAFKLAIVACNAGHAYIQFGLKRFKGYGQTIMQDGDTRIVCPQTVALRTTAQVVTRQAAETLLERTRIFDRPIDVFLQMHWLTGVKPVMVTPSGIIDRTDDVGGTTIHSSKTLSERLSREWSRFAYRQSIRNLSRLHKNG